MHLSIDELDDINYTTYASDIKLWLKSQEYVDHITKKKVTSIASIEIPC